MAQTVSDVLRLGVDVGSTTVKAVVLDPADNSGAAYLITYSASYRQYLLYGALRHQNKPNVLYLDWHVGQPADTPRLAGPSVNSNSQDFKMFWYYKMD